MGRRALFLDRDGTLIVDTGYVRDPASVALLPGVAEALRQARALGYDLVVVSNQSGVARGIISADALAAVERRFEELLAAEGVTLDDVRFCLHGPDEGCPCRKPAPGLLLDAAAARGIDLERSFMVGDKPSDAGAGRAAGCTTILLAPPDRDTRSVMEADHVVLSLIEAIPIVARTVPPCP
jgi:D-glycero-D-manno-heptose 1,7-bisphosphate phosphatase